MIDYPHADMTITVEAGITAAALRAVLAEQNQRLLIDVPQADRATLGGVFATNTCGPRRFGLGRPRDQIIGVSFVTSEGVEVKGGGRVVKNVAGLRLPQAPDRLDGHARDHHPDDPQGPPACPRPRPSSGSPFADARGRWARRSTRLNTSGRGRSRSSS